MNRNPKCSLPLWIWHSERMDKTRTVIATSFTLSHRTRHISLYLALTGSAIIEWNGIKVGELQEDAGNIAQFHKLDLFPETLEAGTHMLRFIVACTEPMPVSPVSIHLSDRRVGFSAFMTGDEFWHATDDTWSADGDPAVMICRYGEEPYGDLENTPEWFIKGGYGDIATAPISNFHITRTQIGEAIRTEGLKFKGNLNGAVPFPLLQRNELHQFYHLRKQNEWHNRRLWQNKLDLSSQPFVSVDLMMEYNARIRVVNKSSKPVGILWNGAESNAEMMSYDSCITEWFEVGPQETVVTLPQGMRYIELYVFGPSGVPFELELEFEAAGVPLRQAGEMKSDSELLNRIYDVSVHTNRICHQLGLWDGIKRDRLNWVYDFYLAAKADYVLWDDLTVLRRSIHELGRGTPAGYWMNSINAYTLWWFVNLWEYFWFTGDKAFLLEIRGDISKHIMWVEENLDPGTGFFKEKHPAFLEWVPIGEEESWFGLHALLVMAYENLKKLSGHIPELGLNVNWRKPNIPESTFLGDGTALITALLGIASGYVSRETAVRFLEDYKLSDPLTPISAYWLAEIYALHGMMEKAWDVIRVVWGTMLDHDATSFWESIALTPQSDIHDSLTTYTAYSSYRISLCHAWASTPVQWISRFILGIEPLEPGYARVRFQPNAVSGVTQCSGKVYTPHGVIEIRWRMLEDGEIERQLDLPGEIEMVDKAFVRSRAYDEW